MALSTDSDIYYIHQNEYRKYYCKICLTVFSASGHGIYIVPFEFTELHSVGVYLRAVKNGFLHKCLEEQSVHVQNSIPLTCPVVVGIKHMDSISMYI